MSKKKKIAVREPIAKSAIEIAENKLLLALEMSIDSMLSELKKGAPVGENGSVWMGEMRENISCAVANYQLIAGKPTVNIKATVIEEVDPNRKNSFIKTMLEDDEVRERIIENFRARIRNENEGIT